jgi:5'-methylthioadenosine phosphorylase
MTTIGVIGGSGLYEMPGLEDVERVRLETPFGDPSDEYVCGTLGGKRMVFLPRHGRGHRLLPTEVNYRANIFGMKVLGVEQLVGVGAVGSLREDVHPGQLLVPDQMIDRTRQRASTFFGRGIVAHVAFADPVCGRLGRALGEAGRAIGATLHEGGAYVCMEGPQFSTRAESHLYRSWGGTVIGMTNLQEAKLAREAEICFATLALVTDYDCWRQHDADVAIEDILRIMHENVGTAQRLVAELAARLDGERACACGRALEYAIITDPARIPEKIKNELAPITGRVLGRKS